jgi:hypothetical protein
MKPDYQNEPWCNVPEHLREWFGERVKMLETDRDFPLWRVALPQGSGMDDVNSISQCLRTLFPKRARADCFQPVAAEFKL